MRDQCVTCEFNSKNHYANPHSWSEFCLLDEVCRYTPSTKQLKIDNY